MKAPSLMIPAALLWGAAEATPVISEIDRIGNKAEIVNTGTSDVNLTGYFWCNLWRGGGAPYLGVSAAQLDLANSDVTTLVIGPGQVATFNLPNNILSDNDGELGLYKDGNFASSASIVDYVAWGGNSPTRDTVADGAGIWVEGTFVVVSGSQAGETIQLGEGKAGNVAEDYVIAPSTIGVNQVQPPAPVELVVTDVSRVGDDLTVLFTGPAEVAPGEWQVVGSSTLAGFPDDKTASSTITESPASSGNYQAVIDVAGTGLSYFVKIVLPE